MQCLSFQLLSCVSQSKNMELGSFMKRKAHHVSQSGALDMKNTHCEVIHWNAKFYSLPRLPIELDLVAVV